MQAHKYGTNGTFWAINRVLSEKGYSETYDKDKADYKISLSVKVERDVEQNILTKLKDIFDSNNETDYVMNYQHKTQIKVLGEEGELISTSVTSTGKTINNYIQHDDEIAEESVVQGAKLIESLPSCEER